MIVSKVIKLAIKTTSVITFSSSEQSINPLVIGFQQSFMFRGLLS